MIALRQTILLAILSSIPLSARPDFAFASSEVVAVNCFYLTTSNSPPTWAAKKCEVKASLFQGGFYRFDIRFNSHRNYVVEGDYAYKSVT